MSSISSLNMLTVYMQVPNKVVPYKIKSVYRKTNDGHERLEDEEWKREARQEIKMKGSVTCQ